MIATSIRILAFAVALLLVVGERVKRSVGMVTLQSKMLEGQRNEYWPGSKSTKKPVASVSIVTCCVKLDDNNNFIGGFVKNGPCMVKSTVISMAKSDCEAIGKGSLLEEEGQVEQHLDYWPGSKSTKTPLAVVSVVKCCVKLDDKNNFIGGFVKKGPCMVKSTVMSMSKSNCEAIGKGSLLEEEGQVEQHLDYWPGSQSIKTPFAVVSVGKCCVKLDDNNNFIGGFVKNGPCMVKSIVISMPKSDCETIGQGSLLEEEGQVEQHLDYWPGSKSTKTPAAVVSVVKCCVKLDDNNNFIGGFVKNGPCMVKSTVISMAKSDCEAIGKGSLLEEEGQVEQRFGYWPGSKSTKTPVAIVSVVKCCVKLDDNNNFIGGFVKIGPCMVKSTVISMGKSDCESIGKGSLLEEDGQVEQRLGYWPGSKSTKTPVATVPVVKCCVKLDDNNNFIGGFVTKGPCMVKSTVISMAKSDCEAIGKGSLFEEEGNVAVEQHIDSSSSRKVCKNIRDGCTAPRRCCNSSRGGTYCAVLCR